jgi:hypothetical protein
MLLLYYRRKTNWDQPPTLDGLAGLGPQALAAVAAAGGLSAISVGGVVPSVDRQSRRLYVGNIPAGITENEMMEFFNTAMITAKAVARFVFFYYYFISIMVPVLFIIRYLYFRFLSFYLFFVYHHFVLFSSISQLVVNFYSSLLPNITFVFCSFVHATCTLS